MNVIPREQELKDLSSEIQVRSDILSTLREQESELIQLKETREVELRIIKNNIREANKSLTKKIQQDQEYSNPITSKANVLLEKAKSNYQKSFISAQELLKEANAKKEHYSELLKEVANKAKLNKLKEDSLDLREKAIIDAEQRNLLDKVEMSVLENKRAQICLESEHNEKLISQNKKILEDIERVLKDIQKEKTDLLAIKGSTQSLARLYANR